MYEELTEKFGENVKKLEDQKTRADELELINS